MNDSMNDVCLVLEDRGPRSAVPSSPRDSGVTPAEEKPTRRHRCNKTSAFFFSSLRLSHHMSVCVSVRSATRRNRAMSERLERNSDAMPFIKFTLQIVFFMQRAIM